MQIQNVNLSQIKEAPFNYNLHPKNQVSEIVKSLQEFGQFKNIIVWKGFCIAGNGLIAAARTLGWEAIKAVIRDDLTEEQAKRLCVADNAAPYLSRPDVEKLEDLLKSLPACDDIPCVDEKRMGFPLPRPLPQGEGCEKNLSIVFLHTKLVFLRTKLHFSVFPQNPMVILS